MDSRKLIGAAVMVAVVFGLVAWVVSSDDPRLAIQAVGVVFAVILAIALVAALLADERHFDGPRRSMWDFALIAVFAVLTVKLMVDGQASLAVASALGIAVMIVVRIRQHPRSEPRA